MKKRIVSLALTAVMALSCTSALLAGCGKSGGGGGGNGGTPSAGSGEYEHKIVFYSSQGDKLVQQTANAIARFEAKYPGWKVEHIQPGGYDEVKDKITGDLQGRLQPDLAYCYPDHVASYLPSRTVLDMLPFINSTETVKGVNPDSKEKEETDYVIGYTQEELDDFVPGFYAEGKAPNYGGYAKYGYTEESMLTLPFVKSTELLYYNETALKKLGLKVPETWDELWAQAKPLQDRYPKATLLGYDSEANWFITMCEQNGWGYTSANESQHFLFNQNNAALKSWLTLLSDKWNNGDITTQGDYGGYTSALFTKGVEGDAGGALYCIGSSGGASNQYSDKFTAKIAPIPGSKQADGSINKSVISQGPSLVMFKAGHDVSNADEKAKMTFLFVKELLDPYFQASFSIAAGYNPCRESVYELDEYIEHMESGDMTAMACLAAKDLSDRFFTSPAFEKSSLARQQVGTALLEVMQGAATADEALKTAYRNCGGK